MPRVVRTLHGDRARRATRERLQLMAFAEAQDLALALGSTRRAVAYMAAVGTVEVLDVVDMNQWHGHPLQSELGGAIREALTAARRAVAMIENHINEGAS